MYYTHHEKTTLPIQDIFVEHFYIWGHSFSLGQILCGINLKLYFRGNFFCGETFFSQVFVFGANFILGGFFPLGEFCVWEI